MDVVRKGVSGPACSTDFLQVPGDDGACFLIPELDLEVQWTRGRPAWGYAARVLHPDYGLESVVVDVSTAHFSCGTQVSVHAGASV
jgi:hypothetical protein